MRSLIIVLAIIVSGFSVVAYSQSVETGFLNRIITYDGEERLYQVYVPANYSEKENWPVILFLHGAGERGDDGLSQTTVGIANAIRAHVDRYQAIVVMPQSKIGVGWNSTETPLAMQALDSAISEFSIDEDRVYLSGLSNGGYGSWTIAYQHTERFAATLVICGYLSVLERPSLQNANVPPSRIPEPAVPANGEETYRVLAEKLENLPTWIFHGEADTVVSADGSRRIYQALKVRNAPVHYTELPGVGHNSWDSAYNSKQVIEWLLSQKR